MLAVAADMQHGLLMLPAAQPASKRARASRADLRHLSLEEKLEVRALLMESTAAM